MALVKFGSIIVDSRGRVNGNQLHLSRYGIQLQKLNLPPKTTTPKRSVLNATFATLSKAWWQTLTSTQRDDWRTLAAANPLPNRWGDLFALTGLSYYIKLNLLLAQAGLSTTDDAPTDQAVTAPTAATLTITAPSTVTVTFTATPAPANHLPYLRMTGPLSPGIANPGRRFRFLSAGAVAETSPWDVYSEFSTAIGTPLPGRQYFAQLMFLNSSNAALSAPIAADTIAT